MLADSSRSQLLRGSILRFHFTPLSLTSNSDAGEQARAAISLSLLGSNPAKNFAVADETKPRGRRFHAVSRQKLFQTYQF